MSDTRDLLIEIGTEELPPKALLTLAQAFRDEISAQLAKAELQHNGVKEFCTPRRLALLVYGLAERQPDRQNERRGPALNAAFDAEGNATKAAQGFAASCGVTVDQLERMETEKGAWLVHRAEQAGEATAVLLPEMVRSALDRLPIPKRMRWGAQEVEFVRPVHWLVLLFGDEVIPATIYGATTGRESRGHRFHHPAPLYIGEPAAYEALLLSEGRVMADFADRREAIRAQVLEAAKRAEGTAVIDEALLQEVTGLVEWPVAVTGRFDSRFLEVPPEALVSAMKGHQKYFHLVDQNGKLMPAFITVANIDSRNPEYVRSGNERVIRPRLADADFFWNQDRRQTLAGHREALGEVVFQKKLGTVRDKTERVAQLARKLARTTGADPEVARRAAELSKSDLMTEMVGEFPELQGIMGRYYAAAEGLGDDIAIAMDEQYMPRSAGDRLPGTATGQAVALADRIDTLVGIFGIGQLPSGNKDPFALRRAALGVLRIAIEERVDVDLREAIEGARAAYAEQQVDLSAESAEQLYEFTVERLRGYYLDQGFAHDTFEAVAARKPERPLDFDLRLRAVDAFRKLPEAEALAAANKRIHNILRKAAEAGETLPAEVDPALLAEPAEQTLAAQVAELAREVEPLFSKGAYAEALERLAALRDAVDRFFDDVMVMADDPAVRRNRLALLDRLGRLFLGVADISRLQG